MSIKEDKAYWNNTPHGTIRLFINKQWIWKNQSHIPLLDGLSIWGGADWSDDKSIGWEFEERKTHYIEVFCDDINSKY